MSLKTINTAIKTLLIFLFLCNTAFGLYLPLIAIYVTDHIVGASLTALGISSALFAIVKSIIQVPLAKRLDKTKGERADFYALLVGVIIGIAYSIGFIFMENILHLYALQMLAGVSHACVMAAFYSIFSHHLDKGGEGFEWSLFSVGGITISSAVGGVIGGWVATHYGFSALFFVVALFYLFAAITLLALFPYIKTFRKHSPV